MRKISAVILSVLILSAGCASGPDYGKINRHLRKDQCARLIDYLEDSKSSYGRNQELLYLLDSAMVHMNCRRFEKACFYFHKAEDLAERLWTKSISREAASLVWNEYTKPYDGEDFERAMINLFSALSYAGLERYEDALVECRRLNSLLSLYNEKYREKNVYKEDAFARYLSAMLYEAAGQADEAFIDYFRAFRTFRDYRRSYGTKMPEILLRDLCRTAEQVNRVTELRKAGLRPDRHEWISSAKAGGMAKVVFIHFMGHAPVKVENRLTVYTSRGPVKIAFPEYRFSPPECSRSRLILESDRGRIEASSCLVEDINSIAVKNLRDRKSRIMTKVLARAAAKQLVIRRVSKEADSESLGFGLNAANYLFVEKADTRSWRTLPGEIHLARLFVKPGEYMAYADVCSCGKIFKKTVSLGAGSTEFILCATRNGDIIF